MTLAEALQEAARFQAKYWNREDSELQAQKAARWQAVADAIEQMIDERIKQRSTLRRKVG
jgi:hypothetical protein